MEFTTKERASRKRRRLQNEIFGQVVQKGLQFHAIYELLVYADD
jgi:hypothetical protein